MRRGLVQSCVVEGETVADRAHKEPESETLIIKPQPDELPRLAPNVRDVVGIRSGVISESMPRIAWFIISYASLGQLFVQPYRVVWIPDQRNREIMLSVLSSPKFP
jgi:hypothetical protein